MALGRSETVAIVTPVHWWALALIGVFQIVAGVVALVYTGITLLALGIIFGVNLLFAGTLLVVFGAADETASSGVKTVRIVIGMLTTLAGLIAIVRPGASVLVLLLCLSLWFLLSGIGWLVEALTSPDHRIINAILGLAGIAAGIILVGDPDIGLNTLANLAGILLIIRGAIELAGGLAIRSATS
jgi:uncharacterized membrane protein HdeD (DUF308 family)